MNQARGFTLIELMVVIMLIAAAYVLARIDRPQTAERVRVAVDAVAHEPVRVALQQAAAGELDEVAIDEALRALGR